MVLSSYLKEILFSAIQGRGHIVRGYILNDESSNYSYEMHDCDSVDSSARSFNEKLYDVIQKLTGKRPIIKEVENEKYCVHAIHC